MSKVEEENLSKLSKFENYIEEIENNDIYLTNIIKLFNKTVIDYLNLAIEDNSLSIQNRERYRLVLAEMQNLENYFSSYRLRDVAVSVTDDLLRYSQYHRIKKMKTNPTLYSISESVRASYFAKWILKIKPSTLDYLACPDDYQSSDESNDESYLKPRHIVEFPNEYLALIAAHVIFNPTTFKHKRFNLSDFFTSDEVPLVFYSLRYRLNHQDSFSMWLKRVNISLKQAS